MYESVCVSVRLCEHMSEHTCVEGGPGELQMKRRNRKSVQHPLTHQRIPATSSLEAEIA